ncbi:MAG TPA: M15 family metallopeptidase, partial [Gemmatimonadaceae bacterium]|nr:M15 family metallopeptidase [Gemmatimonadaceae bacterium]
DDAGIGVWRDTIDGSRAMAQSGAIGGVSSELLMLPDERMGAVIVTTLDGSNGVARQLASTALRAMIAERRHRPMPPLLITIPVPHVSAAMLAGRYRVPGAVLDLTYITAPSDSDAAAEQLTFRFDSAGTRGALRQHGDTLVREDRLGFGLHILPRGNALIVAGRRFVRDSALRPAPVRPQLAKLVGEYGSDRDIFYILEDHGRIEALARSFFQTPLVRLSDSAFASPRASYFDSEPVRFSFDDAGGVTGVRVGGVWLPRRAIGPASGNQLLVTPVRPIAELEREARAAKAPVEAGRRAPQLVELVALDTTIHLEIRYATTHNFLGTRFYPEARAFLQRPAAEALVRAHRWLRTKGYGILVHDSYRPWYVTRMFWDAVPADKKIFVADPSQGSRHNRGAAADITLYDLATGAPVEMPGTYDETSDRSFANYPGGTSLQRWHRALLRQAMEAEGFTVYHAEWWHFDYRGWAEYPVLNIPFSDIPPALTAPH